MRRRRWIRCDEMLDAIRKVTGRIGGDLAGGLGDAGVGGLVVPVPVGIVKR